eukprot:CAMPEP_0114269744 /NCGR_PEP_ID=MMETSP0058-20121206/26811_1 /TAXON_ID=36894 /ORGANISM="Pyramimonas parkeae, CCMP726" /LENGTH=378 /DNA_ID=CAMNT_0001388321 /DNA_START=206 /DNA_END=1343 /DNA_ORIENTATION=-
MENLIPGTTKRPRKSFREKTFVAGTQQRKREFDKQMQILKDRGAALAVSTGSEIALGVVTREGEPVLWCTPGLEEFMVRDCDFNDSAPCAVVVSKMVQARRSQMAATLAGLPLEDKQKALRAMLELLFRGGAPAEGAAPGGAVHAHHAWYPPKVPFKAPEAFTLQDRDGATGELHIDMLIKAGLRGVDHKQLEVALQAEELGLSLDSLTALLVCVRKHCTTIQPPRKGLAKAKAQGRLLAGGSVRSARPPPNPLDCHLVMLDNRPFLGSRATAEQVKVCLNNEPSIKYNKGGVVKVCGHTVQLHELYNEVREHGGQSMLTENKAWKKVAAAMNLTPCNAHICRSLRNTYMRYLSPISGSSPHQSQEVQQSLIDIEADE